MTKSGVSWNEAALLMRLLMHADWDSGFVVVSRPHPFGKGTILVPAAIREVTEIAGRSKPTVSRLLRSLENKDIIKRVQLDGRRLGVRIRLQQIEPERLRQLIGK
ncbi:MAG: hypothetical protein AB1327_01805 [Bacillota bacterium]